MPLAQIFAAAGCLLIVLSLVLAIRRHDRQKRRRENFRRLVG